MKLKKIKKSGSSPQTFKNILYPDPFESETFQHVRAKFSPGNCIKPDKASDPTISYTHKIQDFGEKKNSLT